MTVANIVQAYQNKTLQQATDHMRFCHHIELMSPEIVLELLNDINRC